MVGVLIFTTNHMKLDEDTMVSNNMGMFQMSISKVSWACWLSASATPSAVLTVIFLALNIVFFWIRQLSESDCLRLHIHVSSDLTVLLGYRIVSVWKGLKHECSFNYILSIYTFYTHFLILTKLTLILIINKPNVRIYFDKVYCRSMHIFTIKKEICISY